MNEVKTPQIVFPRIGADGKKYEQKDIQVWFVNEIKAKISDRLDLIISGNDKINSFVKEIKSSLEKILFYTPREMYSILETSGSIAEQYNAIKNITVKYKDARSIKKSDSDKNTVVSNNDTSVAVEEDKKEEKDKKKPEEIPFSDALIRAFNYSYFRKSTLVELARRLNVKTCPYCNQHYTLYVSNDLQKEYEKKGDGQALFQFDHFIDKDDHPYFSMSLYNLVPSCESCNHNKSQAVFDVKLNPYEGNVHSYYSVIVEDVSVLKSTEANPEHVNLTLMEPDGQKTLNSSSVFIPLQNKLHILERYSRHKDIVVEIFDKMQKRKYYREYNWASEDLSDSEKEELINEWIGVPRGKDDIDKTPLTKFRLDILKQAELYHFDDDMLD